MARLIDADALTMEVASSQHNNPHTNGRVRINHHNEHDHFMKMIFDAPTIEAVEVVRCKDCKQWCRNIGFADSPNGHCFCHDIETNGHDFCSYGERRSDVQTTH